MSDELWIGIILVASWASLPFIMIYANAVFDHDVVKEGETAGEHH